MTFIKKVHKPLSITSLLYGGMTGYDPHRGLEKLHASDMTKDVEFCPREYALSASEGKKLKGFGIAAAMRHTFDMGRDIEARVQNDYARAHAVGDWKCTSCGDMRTFCKAPKNGCHRKDINCNWRYSEVRLVIPPMTSGFDLLLDVGKTKLRLVELKTMNIADFTELKAPLAEHRLRTILYLKMVSESPLEEMIDTKVATVLYVAKSHGKFNVADGVVTPFKEYDVEFDEELVAPLWAKGKAYGKFQTSGLVPERICPHAACKRAKSCGVKVECFSTGKNKVETVKVAAK